MKAIFESGNQTLWTVDKEAKYSSFNRKFADTFYDFYNTYPKLGGRLSDLKNNKAAINISDQWKAKEKLKDGTIN